MAASVYGGSPAHHNRIVHNSNGLTSSHNTMMSEGFYTIFFFSYLSSFCAIIFNSQKH